MLDTCAQLIVKFLEKQNLEVVFGLPGSHNMEFFDALRTSRLKTYLATSELTASFMAEAFGKATGKPAVLALVPGPGFTYALTGIAGARLDSVPMLVILAGCRNDLGEKKYLIHESAQGSWASHAAKSFFTIHAVDEVEATLARAVHDSVTGEPGPVVVEIPVNILRMRRTKKTASLDEAPPHTSHVSPDTEGHLKLAAQLIDQSQNPCIYAGQGAFASPELLQALAEKIGAPVATTISGRGAVPEDHPLSVGYGFGPTGESAAQKIFSSCDVLITVGCKFSEMSSGGWDLSVPEKHIRIDSSPEVLQYNFPGSINLAMDAGEALKRLLSLTLTLPEREGTVRSSRIEEICLKEKQQKIKKAPPGKIRPELFFSALRQTLPRNGIMCCDCGAHQFFALSHFPVYAPRTFVSSIDFQAMGFGVPAMIAAQLIFPDRKVVGVVGDGGFLMTGFEMVNVKREQSNPVLFIFRDDSLGLIEGMQKRVYQRTHAVKLNNPDYSFIAAACGVDYCLLDDEHSLVPRLESILQKNSPHLVEVSIHYDRLPRYSRAKMNSSAQKLPFTEKVMAGSRIIARKVFPFSR